MRTAILCPRCGGKAGAAVPAPTANDPIRTVWMDCDLCDGVGDVPPFVAAREEADQRRKAAR